MGKNGANGIKRIKILYNISNELKARKMIRNGRTKPVNITEIYNKIKKV